jgi:type II secretory pathway pseudopilin PulG
MGNVTPIHVAGVAMVIAAAGLLRWVGTSRVAAASRSDLQAIEAALRQDGGKILRTRLDRSRHLVGRNAYLDERNGTRLYHVTLQVGAVVVRRRVAVRDGHPATLLP